MRTVISGVPSKQIRTYGLVLFLCSAAMYGFTTYGGVRSSDSEVVYRVAESLALRGDFSLQSELEDWKAFGVAYGRGGKLYAIFGPLESILLAPLVKVGDLVNETGWYERFVPLLPLSQFTKGGFFDLLMHRTTTAPRPHALRLLTSVFNVVVTALGVYVFWLILLRLTRSASASFLVSLLYALGTMAWPYSGTYFSEPLATLLVLVSFYYLVRSQDEPLVVEGLKSYRTVFLSGIWLGLAVTAHITASLFAPFFALFFFFQAKRGEATVWQRLERGGVFSLGVFVLLFLLGIYNYARFYSFFETGRTISATSALLFGYGTFISPLRGLFGLFFGAGKGLVFYSPAIILGAWAWRQFRSEHRKIFWILVAAVAFRILFVASRSDWHGGFCIGPRYLLMVIPFFLIPLGIWLRNLERGRSLRSIALVAFAAFICSFQQLYFCLGELFSYLQVLKTMERLRGVDVFEGDLLYLNWNYSPIITLKSAQLSPFLLRHLGLTMNELLIRGALVLFAFFFVSFLVTLRMSRDEGVRRASNEATA